MRNIFTMLLLTLCSVAAIAQDSAEVKQIFWGAADPYNKVSEVPEKWKNESAVVIFKNENYDFHKYGKRVTYTKSVRKRVKLLDQAAVKEFSEFSFKDRFYSRRGRGWTFKESENLVGIKVVKPDGSEREINVDKEAVETDEKKKIAIPNLEVGDIIDYYFHSTEPFVSKEAYGFEPEETTLGDEYPIMNLKVSFKTENDFFVNFATYNGAPELKELTPPDAKIREYELAATDIEKNDFPRWFYPLAELPCYKFQVYFARSGKFEDRAAAFLPEKENIIKNKVSKEDVLEYYDGRFVPYGDMKDIKSFLRGKNFKNDEEKVREVYYFTRHQYYTRYIEAFILKEANIMYAFTFYGMNPVFLDNENQFINHFMAFLKSNDIDYDIIVSTPRVNGPIDDLLLKNNLNVMLKVKTPNPVYLRFFSPFTNADQIDYTIEGTNAYALLVSKQKKVSDIENITLPVSTYKDNQTLENITVDISPDMSTLNVKRTAAEYGHNKEIDQGDKMYFYDFVYEDYRKYETLPVIDMVGNKKKKVQFTNEFDALKNKLKDKQKEGLKDNLESEYGFKIDSLKFNIVNTGRFGKADPFTVTEQYNVKEDLVKKAGPNYIIELGKLIGQQAQIEEKDRKRTNNIYIPFPRSFKDEIVFTIPNGYTVSGLEKLTKNVENTTGGFVSSARIDGNKLIVSAYKYYADYYQPVAKWADMVAFLDAAYDFSQEKILLKKQ